MEHNNLKFKAFITKNHGKRRTGNSIQQQVTSVIYVNLLKKQFNIAL